MPIFVTDSAGKSLLGQPAKRISVAGDFENGGLASLQCRVQALDGYGEHQYVTASLNWNDGTAPQEYSSVTRAPLDINTQRRLRPGRYLVRMDVQGYVPKYTCQEIFDRVTAWFVFEVTLAGAPDMGIPILYGPILPKDEGYPNVSQWNWNWGTDMEILVSSVKMLLSTAKGERLMLPEYGTNIRKLIFDPNLSGITELIEYEIVQALAQWEPRVSLAGINIQRRDDKSVHVDVNLISNIRKVTFPLGLDFKAD
jgi:phage baseplate assembly protein W